MKRVRVLWGKSPAFSKVSPSVESKFFSSSGFIHVRVLPRFRSMPIRRLHKRKPTRKSMLSESPNNLILFQTIVIYNTDL